jgi:hypothetical protein
VILEGSFARKIFFASLSLFALLFGLLAPVPTASARESHVQQSSQVEKRSQVDRKCKSGKARKSRAALKQCVRFAVGGAAVDWLYKHEPEPASYQLVKTLPSGGASSAEQVHARPSVCPLKEDTDPPEFDCPVLDRVTVYIYAVPADPEKPSRYVAFSGKVKGLKLVVAGPRIKMMTGKLVGKLQGLDARGEPVSDKTRFRDHFKLWRQKRARVGPDSFGGYSSRNTLKFDDWCTTLNI